MELKSFTLEIVFCLFVRFHACVCTTYMPGALGNPRRSPGPQQLELQVDVNTLRVPETEHGF